jgi:hypothetical protein
MLIQINLSLLVIIIGVWTTILIIGWLIWQVVGLTDKKIIMQFNGEIYQLRPQQFYRLLHYRLSKQAWPEQIPGKIGPIKLHLNNWSITDMQHAKDLLTPHFARRHSLTPH